MRTAEIQRKTRETDINAVINLDKADKPGISTGVGFFDHMLTAFATHGGFELSVDCKGDLHVDCHHTIEDVGIVLGKAVRTAIDSQDTAITRYGSARIPMDESIGWCDMDISSRPYLVFKARFTSPAVGGFDTQMVEEFMRAFAFNAGITLHIGGEGENDHHIIEAMFKALAYAFKAAVKPNNGNVVSTKGVL